MEQNFTQVNSLDQLKQLISDNGINESHECFIQLNGCRSWKVISYNEEEDKWFVIDEIDDTEQELTSQQMRDTNYSNIGYAISKGAFYYGWC